MSPSIDTVAAMVLLLMLMSGGFGAVVPAVRTARLESLLTNGPIAAVVVVAAWLRFAWVPPHHAMYVDEPWYLESARNLLHRGALLLCERAGDAPVCTPYTKAAGWPVVLAAAFALFGSGSRVAFAFGALLSTLAVWGAAAVARLAGGSRHQTVFAALLVAVHPLHVAWSATAETNAASSAILLAGVAGVLRLRRAPSPASSGLAAGGLGLAAAMRPEMAMAVPPALIVLALARVRRRDLLLVALGGALGSTSVIASWPLYLSNSSGMFLSPDHLGPNFTRLLAGEEGGAVTLVILALSLAGTLAAARRRAAMEVTLLGGGALLVGLVAVGYDQRIFYPRTVLGSLVLLAPLAAFALPGRRAGIRTERIATASACALTIALALPGLRHAHRVPDPQMLETRVARAVAATPLPADAVVIAEWPTVLAAEADVVAVPARSVVTASDATLGALAEAIVTRPHFVLCDMFCEANLAQGASACTELLRAFALEEVTAVSDHHRRYGLYRLVRRTRPGDPSPPCPFPSPGA